MQDRYSNENAALGKFGAVNHDGAFTDSFFGGNGATTINTPLLLIDPERNHNGIDLLDTNICEIGASTPWFILVAAKQAPASVYDGYQILAPNNITATIAMGDTVNPIYLEPNYGLYLFPLVAATSGSRQGLFRIR